MTIATMEQLNGTSHTSSNTGHFVRSDIAAAAGGDVAAFERLVAAHQSVVCSIALAIVRDLEASEEVAQETFIAAWRGLSKLRSPESFLPWLKQLTRARAFGYLRTTIRLRRHETTGPDVEDRLAEAPSANPDARFQLIRQQQRNTLQQALEQLPANASEVLVLFYREGNSIQQVATLLEINEVVVRKRLSRARAMLRAEVEASVGETLARTAPGAAFTAAIIASLTFAVPTTAAAAVIGWSAKGAGSIAAAGALAGAFAGMVGALAGIWIGTRRDMAKAADNRERRGLLVVGFVMSLLVVVFCAMIALSPTTRGTPTAAYALIFAYWVGLNLCVYLGRNKVTSRRRRQEAAADPDASKRDQQEQKKGLIYSIIALIIPCAVLAFYFTWFNRW